MKSAALGCDDGQDPLWLQYHTHALQYLSENVPGGKKASFSSTVDKTGTVFKIVGPKDVAPAKWQDQMLATFAKSAKK